MKRNILHNGEKTFRRRSRHVPMSARLPGAASPATSIRLRMSAAASELPPTGAMPWGAFAAYAAALPSTGFLFLTVLTKAVRLG